MLNNDIDRHIFFILPISDKRSFLRTCKNINQLSIHMPQIESEFQKMLNDTGFFHNRYYSGLYNSLYKYSMELLFDGYKIPNKYIIVENRVLHRFPKIYKRLAERGDMHLIKKMLSLNRDVYNNADYVMRGAAKAGNIKILKWMIRNNYERNEWASAYAAKGNQLKTLKWLIEHNFEISQLATYYAAAGKDRLDILNFLIIDKKCESDSLYAASTGQFEIVKYLHSIDPESLDDICDGAVRCGHIDMMKFGYENGGSINENQFCFCKDVHMLSWLIDNDRIQPSAKISEGIAHAGNLECLQLLYYHEFPVLNKKVFAEAVSGRNIEMINWLHDLNCQFGETATYAAANSPDEGSKKGGSLTILKLLVEWGCKIKCNISCTAAYNGDLEMLKYLQSINCMTYDYIIEKAARNGHLHVIIWAREQECEWDSDACSKTVTDNHLNVLRWLRGFDRDTCELVSDEKEICPWDENICLKAIKYGHVDVLKFALENGCKFGTSSHSATIKSKNLSIIKCVRNYYSQKL